MHSAKGSDAPVAVRARLRVFPGAHALEERAVAARQHLSRSLGVDGDAVPRLDRVVGVRSAHVSLSNVAAIVPVLPARIAGVACDAIAALALSLAHRPLVERHEL